MTLLKDTIEVVLFDYGNTLVEFGQKQIAHCDKALANVVRDICGPVDHARDVCAFTDVH